MRRATLVAAVAVPAVALAGFHVSSFKKETKLGADYWNAASALDAKMETCWMVDPESENTGEWFDLDLPNADVDKLAIVTGWDKDSKTFKDYPRIKAARVELFGSKDDENARVLEQNVTFEDKEGWQVIDLPDTHVGSDMHGGRARVTITDVYPGEDYPNVAVSELKIVLKETDVAKESIKLKEPPATSATGHEPEKMTDGDAKTSWMSTAPGPQTFLVRAEGFGVSSIGLQAGPTTSARPKTVELVANDVHVQYTMNDKPDVQWFELPAVVGYTGSAWGPVTVNIVDTYPGKTDQNVGIAELKMRYTNYEGL